MVQNAIYQRLVDKQIFLLPEEIPTKMSPMTSISYTYLKDEQSMRRFKQERDVAHDIYIEYILDDITA